MELHKKNNGKKRVSQRGVVLLWPCVVGASTDALTHHCNDTITSPPERVVSSYAQQ
jgi:hypothetical protein